MGAHDFASSQPYLSVSERRRPRRQLRHGALRRYRRLRRACGGQPRRRLRLFREAQQVTVPPIESGIPGPWHASGPRPSSRPVLDLVSLMSSLADAFAALTIRYLLLMPSVMDIEP